MLKCSGDSTEEFESTAVKDWTLSVKEACPSGQDDLAKDTCGDCYSESASDKARSRRALVSSSNSIGSAVEAAEEVLCCRAR